jgi:molecular chaperone GrpE (heat shock protein)
MAKTIEIADEFASAMQQLSAQATESIPRPETDESGAEVAQQLATMLEEFRAFSARLEKLEKTVATRFDQLARAEKAAPPGDLAQQFQKLDEQLAGIRNSESINKRLFDSLHEELIGYRDNFLHESLQKPFIRDLIVLFDDLTKISQQLSAANEDATGGAVSLPKQNLDNAIHALIEVLHRLEVKEVEPQDVVDRSIHRVVSFEPTDFQEDDGRIVMRVRRGFMWRDRVLRPEEVIARRFE